MLIMALDHTRDDFSRSAVLFDPPAHDSGAGTAVFGVGGGCKPRASMYLVTFGRVPLFYYLLHLPLLHGAAVLLSFLSYGRASWLFRDFMDSHSTVPPLPNNYGYGLSVVYLVWIGAVVVLYPLCSWFASIKRNNRNIIFSYL
jgi:hypothetical protein